MSTGGQLGEGAAVAQPTRSHTCVHGARSGARTPTHTHASPRVHNAHRCTPPQCSLPPGACTRSHLHAQPFAHSLSHAPQGFSHSDPHQRSWRATGLQGSVTLPPPIPGHTSTAHTHTCATVSTFAPTCARAAEHTHVCTGGHEGSKRIRERTRGHRRTWAPPVGMVTLSPHVSPHPPHTHIWGYLNPLPSPGRPPPAPPGAPCPQRGFLVPPL